MVAAKEKKTSKKKLQPVTGPLAVLDKPVSFGGVSLGKGTGRISIKIDRGFIDVAEAEEMFCQRRLTGKVVLGHAGDAAGQQTIADDINHEVIGAFDAKGFRSNGESVSTSLTFSLKEVDVHELSLFSKGVGRLVIVESGEIPVEPKEKKEDAPIAKATGEWTLVRLDTLPFKPRILKALEKASITTMGELADFTALKGEWWWKDIAGVGEAAAQEIEDITAKFWAANPQVDK